MCFAGFESDAGPAEFAAEFDVFPVVSGFIEEQWFASRDGVGVDVMFFEVVGEGLFDVEEHAVDAGVVVAEVVEDGVDVLGVGDGAVEVGGEPVGVVFDGELADVDDALGVPLLVVAAEFDFEAVEAVGLDPLFEGDGVVVVGFVAGEVVGGEGVEAADEVPCGECFGWRLQEEVVKEFVFEGDGGVGGGGEEGGEVAIHVVAVVGGVGVLLVGVAVGIVEGLVEDRAADECGEVGHVLFGGEVGVVLFGEFGEDLFLEVVAEFEGVAGCFVLGVCVGEFDAEFLQGGEALLVGE